MQKSIFLYPLSSAASLAVNAVPTVENARGAVVEHRDTLRAAAGIRRNMVIVVSMYLAMTIVAFDPF